MNFEKIGKNAIYTDTYEAEPLFGAIGILMGKGPEKEYGGIYGAEEISRLQKKYRFLFETYEAVKELKIDDMFDMLLDVWDEDFSLRRFREHMLAMPAEERIFRMAPWEYLCNATPKEIKKAMEDDVVLDSLYSRVQDRCGSFLGFKSFLRENRRFMEDLFAFTEELDSPALKAALDRSAANSGELRQKVLDLLGSKDPLEVSQSLMGKTFKRRGPYEVFYFMPSLLVPSNVLRLFYEDGTPHNSQILICSIRTSETGTEQTVAALKALADETRYRILELLAAKGPLNGQDIVAELKLAPSTISHHMTELRQSGLTTEESVKNSKFYGVSKKRIKEILDAVGKDLLDQA